MSGPNLLGVANVALNDAAHINKSLASFSEDMLFVSEVVESIPHLGAMRVSSPCSGVINGYAIDSFTNSGYGVRKVGSAYPPHTRVVCYQPKGTLSYCYILGAIPPRVTDGRFNMVPETVVPGSKSGVGYDDVHMQSVKATDNGPQALLNFSAGRPLDELTGDYGYINELGVGFGLSRTMAWLRASYFCGIEAYWLDNLIKIVGYNLEEMTSGSERKAFNDEGEFNDIRRWSPYPWETLGVKDTDTDFVQTGIDEPGKCGYEPVNEDQCGIWRVQEFNGYLGDGHKTVVALPSTTVTIESQANDTVLPGLLDVGYGLDGRYRIRSAKGILLEKNIVIPVPKEKLDASDPTGDTADNYMAAGKFGTGDEHTKEEITYNTDELEGKTVSLSGLTALDRHVLLFSYYANLVFVRHEKDWFLPEEEQVLAALGAESGTYLPSAEINADDVFMPPPKYVEKEIDHRSTVKYYCGKSFIELTDDGSVLIEDAYGSQIRMENGNIILAARNDIVMQPGRNVHMWAPNDAIIKAGNSVDVTASKKDVRIKAQGNLMMVSVDKGILIESQDAGYSSDWNKDGEEVESRGVILRANNSRVSTLAKDVYVRSGASELNGSIYLDANEDQGSVYIGGRDVNITPMQRFQVITGSTGSNEDASFLKCTKYTFDVGGKALSRAIFGAANNLFCAEDVDTTKSVFAGQVLINESILCNGSGIFGGSVAEGAELNDEYGVNIMVNIIADTKKALTAYREDDASVITQLNEALHTDSSVFGGVEVLTKATFGFRTDEQYATEAFIWPEARWQQYNRAILAINTVWEENSIVHANSGAEGMPFPGYKAWTEDGSIVRFENTLYNINTGIAVNREVMEDGENREIKPETPIPMASGYIVTKQGSGE